MKWTHSSERMSWFVTDRPSFAVPRGRSSSCLWIWGAAKAVEARTRAAVAGVKRIVKVSRKANAMKMLSKGMVLRSRC